MPRRSLSLLVPVLAVLVAASPAAGASRDLPQILERLLREGALSRASVGMMVIDAATGGTVFEHHSGRALKPASNMKLVTAAAALSELGPDYVFKTEVYADHRPVDGIVRGNLYVKGYGSPGLGGEQWWLMARETLARDVRRVTGDLVGDATYFDDEDRPRGWPPVDEDAFYNAPISALSADYGAVTIVVSPTRTGEQPRVTLTPFPSFFQVANAAMTRGRTTDLRIDRRFDGRNNVIVVEGSIPESADPSVTYRSVERPAMHALAGFMDAATREGIRIEGKTREGVVPEGAVLVYEHTSRPLSEIVRIMNKLSNNLTAESVLKVLGAEDSGAPGTIGKGAKVLESYLRSVGVDTDGLVIADGSGLSHDSRITASALAAVLVAVYRDFRTYPEFMASLAIGGVDGTLDERMKDGPAEWRIRAKTGHLKDVSSLSGYALTRDGKVLAFSILANTSRNGDVWPVRQALDSLCAEMVQASLPRDGHGPSAHTSSP